MNSTLAGSFATAASAASAERGSSYFQLATNPNATTTAAITNALTFAQSKSVRTSTIILASFNSLAAFATAAGIIYGCWQHKKRSHGRASDPSVNPFERRMASHQLTPSRPSGLFFIHTVEIFPLVLSIGITIQSITFAAAQSVGLQALLSRGCTLVAIFMLPAVFIVPLTHLVFGIEAAVRGLRTRFAPRGRWNVAMCIGTVVALCIAALIVAAVDQAPDFCFASLFWYLRKYAPGCFGAFLSIAVMLLVVIAVVFLKLNRTPSLDSTERMAITRMIYYLCLGFISNAFVIPFFFSLTFLDQKKYILDTINLSMVASVVSNVNGLMVAGLHLFLRSQNSATYASSAEQERKKSIYDPRDPSDDRRGSNLSLQPVRSPKSQGRERCDSISALLHAADVEEGRSIASPMSYGAASRGPVSPKLFIPSNPTYPEPTQPPSETSPSQMRKQSYSVFPQESSPVAAAGVLPATTYSPMTTKPLRDTWKPPPIVKPWASKGHKRDSSIVSTATVQIGIRLSNVEDYIPRKSTDTDVPDVPEVPDIREMPTMPALLPSPLAKFDSMPAADSSSSVYEDADIILSDPPRTRSIKESKMKNLPPVPRSPAGPLAVEVPKAQPEKRKSLGDEWVTLTPAVYTPKEDFPQRTLSNRSINTRKLPSPMGVGFNNPGRSGLSPKQAPPRPSPSGSSTPLLNTSTKADWI